jgi:HSP20 family protein
MAETATKLPIRTADSAPASAPAPRRRDWPSFADLRREVDALFDDFGRDWFRVPSRLRDFDLSRLGGLAPTPAVDVVENGTAFKITAELPGLEPSAVDVRVSGDMLTIRGEKSETKEEDEHGRHVSERRYGAFERGFTLPETVDRSAIEATFANGILTVTLPKRPAAAAEETKIDVKAA